MVLVPQDSAGPTALLKGEALKAWQDFDQSLDMYNIAEEKAGPRYTRQVYRGGRLYQSRLDRMYISQRGVWLGKASKLTHDGQEALSDHIPILAEVEVKEVRHRCRKKRERYLKMDADTLKDPTRRAEAGEAWLAGWALSEDPIIAWEWLGAENSLESGGTEQENEEYARVEKAVHEGEILEANMIRQRSIVKWVKEGEANEDGILESLHQFYQNLYHQEPVTEKAKAERREVLELTTKFVEAGDNQRLVATPGPEEIKEIVDRLARNKAPGEDGITVEVLKILWEWDGGPCNTFISEVWRTLRLGKQDRVAVVKLLPKNSQKMLLRNWRPISLLSLTFQIIGRIMASRLKTIIPKLVDEDQTGFVHGRSITDNIICLKMCQDVTNLSKGASNFL
ncbi:hypothetical protein R1sor_027067 [Riccia sorocarpa]|uniref:Reverse transcriptase domain-containing protein n=1 Tax=Riccia sorocarpa TaxID=122646 RepID=A0ABD3GIX9_9MARC